MTHNPGEGQPPEDPYRQPTPDQGQQPGQNQPGYWQQQGQQPGQQRPYQVGDGQGYGQPVQFAPDHPQATTSLVLGILGVVLCQVLAPFAWIMGRKTVAEIDASQGRFGGRGAAQAGYILGIVGTVLLGLAVLLIVAYFVFFAVMLGTMSSEF